MHNEHENDLCRYCLEPEEPRGNSLISPCICVGTVGRVHTKCFRRWYKIQLERGDALECPICKSPYNDSFCPRFERIPENTYITFFLGNTLLVNFGIHYVWILYDGFHKKKLTHDIFEGGEFYLQIGLHAAYLLLFFREVRIRNRALYFAVSGLNYLVYFSMHIWLWMQALEGGSLYGFSMTLLLSMYWRFHVQALKNINVLLLKDF